MGDSEDKTIEYSPEELEEINRIINDNFTPEPGDSDDTIPASDETAGQDEETGDPDSDTPPINVDDLPRANFDFDTSPETVDSEDEPQDISDLISVTDDISEIDDLTSEITEIPDDDITVVEDVPDDTEQTDALDDISDTDTPGDIEDIEDLTDSVETLDDLTPDETSLEPEIDIIDDPETIETPDEITDIDLTESTDDGTDQLDGKSPIDQLDALTSNEPESLDIQDITEDTFVDDTPEPAADDTPPPPDDNMDDDIPDITDIDDDLPDISDSGDIETVADDSADQGLSLDSDDSLDIPDLSDIDDLGDADDIPDATDSDIPDIGIEDISADDGLSDIDSGDTSGTRQASGTDSLDDLPDIDDIDIEEPGDEPQDVAIDIPATDLDVSDDSLDDIEPLGDDDDDDLEIVPDDQEVDDTRQEDIELSDKELKKLRSAIILFNPGLIKAIKDTIINDRLPAADNRQMLDLILSGKPESNVHRFLEKKLGTKIELTDETKTPRRKVIRTRAEYTTEGRERQKRLLKITKIFGISALTTVVAITALYLLVLKPKKVKDKVRDGVAIILKVGDEHKNFKKAEELFTHVDDYMKDPLAFFKEKIYVYGSIEYGRAYFQKAEYTASVKKLNNAYNLKFKNNKKVDIDTLINLGEFYAKVPKRSYRRNFRNSVNKWYYHDPKTYKKQRSQLDVSIYLYKRALLQETDNIRALYGIGNAYYYQGQYVKAEKYYKDILKIDKNSMVGYSGLLNLYIERDVFQLVSQVHTDLKYKEKLHKLESPLLAKLSYYYLSKKRTKEQNIRIDYGVQSSNIIDKDDNPYPAIQSVLRALNKRDPYYPPLQIQSALVAKAKKNYQVMKIHLERALDYTKSKYNSDNYFAALHLLGEYYYHIKHPVKAYSYLKRASTAWANQPNFTRHEFYKETEKPGHTYALMGNVFYYFFEKAKHRFGDLDDDTISKDIDRLASYNIARKKYEKALAANFSSSEVHYNLGRIYYLNKEYRKALDSWIRLYDDFVDHPDIMYSLGNAYYHIRRYEAAKGEYLKLISMYEHDAGSIMLPRSSNPRHVRIFSALASAYNNLGAVYQLQNNESKSLISYWKAIEYAKKIQKENPYARVNKARGFRKRREPEGPILDENIPFSIKMYREPKN